MNFLNRFLQRGYSKIKRNVRLYYASTDLWPPKNHRRRWRVRFFLLEVPIRRLFRGVLPQNLLKVDNRFFKTFFNEHVFINEYFNVLGCSPKNFVDIGAGDGIDMSNTFLLARNGVPGIAIETNPLRFYQLSATYEKIPSVTLIRSRVSSNNVLSLITTSTSEVLDLLSLDIDSFDRVILQKILSRFRPRLLVLEFNRAYPPEVFFSVLETDDFLWNGSDLMQGASLSAWEELLNEFSYKMIAIQGAALFASPMESNDGFDRLSADILWQDLINGPEEWRTTPKSYWDKTPDEMLIEISRDLAEFRGKFELRLRNKAKY